MKLTLQTRAPLRADRQTKWGEHGGRDNTINPGGERKQAKFLPTDTNPS